MTQQKKRDWASHLSDTKDYPPSPLLVRAVALSTEHAKALDMGAGALKDTKYLLKQGFDVTALDSEPLMQELAQSIQSNKLHVVLKSFEDYVFPKETFDLVSSMFSLPFINPQSFQKVFEQIVASLKDDGIFCGQFFGINDSWHTNATMTFHNTSQVKKLLSGLKVIELDEQERDSKTANGTQKHWHIFHVIAKKEK